MKTFTAIAVLAGFALIRGAASRPSRHRRRIWAHGESPSSSITTNTGQAKA